MQLISQKHSWKTTQILKYINIREQVSKPENLILFV